MNKINGQTPDLTKENIQKIAELFPQVVTEREGEDGVPTRSVDFDLLRQALSDSLVDGADERYRLDWPGKRASLLKANTPIVKTLRPDRASSVDFDTTQNVFIEGDNFEALKILQESYLGKVKMIYIDPPYNTGKDFVYSDNFTQNKAEYDEEIEAVDEDGNKMFRENTRTNPRFHSDWLSMMYERLIIARDLLQDDGVIFISIDDNEVHNLRKVCDEIFGESNFVDIFNWVKTETPANLSMKSKKVIEYILCYQKAENQIRFKGIKKETVSSNGLLNQTNPIGVLHFPSNLVKTSIEDNVITAGMYGTDAYDVELLENTEVQNGVFIKDVKLRAKFKWSQTYLEEQLKAGTIISIPTLRFSPAYEKLDYEPEVPPNLINSKVGVNTNENAGEYLSELFGGKKVFSYPKPYSLIQYLMGFIIEEGDTVLDFFAGSSTTADAVVRFSIKSKCKFICIQYPEELHESNANSDSEKQIVRNAIHLLTSINKKNNIAELSKERIRRAVTKIKTDYADKLAERESPLDTGFRAYTVADTAFLDVERHPSDLEQGQLLELANNIKNDRTPEDLLTQVMLGLGLTLDLPIETKQIGANTVFYVAHNALVACFDESVPTTLIDEMAKCQPLQAAFKDASFGSDDALINAETHLKRLSPDTILSVI